MSGVKGRSGRNRATLPTHLRFVLADTLTDDDWRQLFRALQETALSGTPEGLRAAELLLRFGIGPVKPEPEPNPDFAGEYDELALKIHGPSKFS